MKNARKVLLLVLCLVLVVSATVMGTLAYLTASTSAVENTFSVGNVAITLVESPRNDDGTYGNPAAGTHNQYPMIPGATYTKDPVVTVTAGSEKCYLFVKFEEGTNNSGKLEYTSNLKTPDWTKLEGVTGVDNVWYRVVDKSETDTSFQLLAENEIKISDEVKNGDTADGLNLTYTAYAVQFDNIENVQAAWAAVNP